MPFNPVDIDSNGNWHRASKGAPKQIFALCNAKEDLKKEVHSIIDKFADRGLRSLAVARQVFLEIMIFKSLLCYFNIEKFPYPFSFATLPASARKNKRKCWYSMAICWFVASV